MNRYIDIYLPDPSAQAGCDTRLIFWRSLTGLNSVFLLAITRLKSPVCPTIYL